MNVVFWYVLSIMKQLSYDHFVENAELLSLCKYKKCTCVEGLAKMYLKSNNQGLIMLNRLN